MSTVPALLAWFVLFLVAAFAAALFVPRLLPARRVRQPAGTAAVSPERSSPASGEMAAPAVTAQARGEATRPFAYDNGLIVGERES
jgi:hypothetical protein